jgi:hypothetical protein
MTQKLYKYLLFALVFFTEACTPPPDLPPFVITVTVLDNSTSVRLDWPLVQDSRLGTIYYDVYLGNTRIAQNITANSYTINNLQYNTLYSGKLVGRINTGDSEEQIYSFTTGKEYISIPDVGLESALISGGFDTEGIVNKKMLKEDAPSVKVLNAKNLSISNLEGIQHFTNLEEIDLSNNSITQINLASNLKINKVNLNGNLLTNVNFSPNVNLKALFCAKNNINQLNITQNTLLETLVADNNKLASIDISRNNLLYSVGLSFNLLNQINLSANARLNDLDLSNNPISGISLSGNGLLYNFACQSCALTGIGIGNLTNLNYLDISGNQLLRSLDVSNNRLTGLNIKNNPNIISLNTTNNNNLSQICVTNVTAAQNNLDWVVDIFTLYNSNCN